MCPYCGVGCGQMVFHKDGELISIEGDPGSPISRGHLCPKGADTFELHTHPNRLMTVKYRRPYATEWEEHRSRDGDGYGRRPGVGDARADSFVEEKDGADGDADHEDRASRRRHPR